MTRRKQFQTVEIKMIRFTNCSSTRTATVAGAPVQSKKYCVISRNRFRQFHAVVIFRCTIAFKLYYVHQAQSLLL